MNITEAVS